MENKKLITLSLVGFLAMTLVSAGLVNYLSNSQDVDVIVVSPLGLVTTLTTISGGVAYGGEIVEVDSTIVNHIAESVSGVLTMIITTDLVNATCGDFDSIMVTSNGGDTPVATCNDKVTDVSIVDGVAIVTFSTIIPGSSAIVYNVDLELKQNVQPAHYYVDNRVMIT